jgi:hypothetical protein
VCTYTPKNIKKLTLQPIKEAITREIPYLVQELIRYAPFNQEKYTIKERNNLQER